MPKKAGSKTRRVSGSKSRAVKKTVKRSASKTKRGGSKTKRVVKKRATSKARPRAGVLLGTGGVLVGAGRKSKGSKSKGSKTAAKGGARKLSAYNIFVKKFLADFKKSKDYAKYSPRDRMSLAAKAYRERK
jgi:hypothetical protein